MYDKNLKYLDAFRKKRVNDKPYLAHRSCQCTPKVCRSLPLSYGKEDPLTHKLNHQQHTKNVSRLKEMSQAFIYKWWRGGH